MGHFKKLDDSPSRQITFRRDGQLSGTKVTDRGLDSLQACEKLESIDLPEDEWHTSFSTSPGIPRSGNRPGIYAGHELALFTDESPVYGAFPFAALANQARLNPWRKAS